MLRVVTLVVSCNFDACKTTCVARVILREKFVGSQAGGILQTLQCGLTANDIDVLQSSLDALGALMRVAASDPQIPGPLLCLLKPTSAP